MLIDWLGMLKMRERKMQNCKMRETEKYGTPQVHYTDSHQVHQQIWHYKNVYVTDRRRNTKEET